MVNSHTVDQEKLVDTRTYPQIAAVSLPEGLAARLPGLAAESRTFSHPPLFTVADGAEFRDAFPERGTKNLFLKDKKDTLWLLTAWHHTTIDLTAFSAFLRARGRAASRFSFAAPALMLDVLGVTPGSVTPLALVNDRDRRVNVALDAALLQGPWVSCHPLRNDMTTIMRPPLLLSLLRGLGYRPLIVDFSGESPRSVEEPVLSSAADPFAT